MLFKTVEKLLEIFTILRLEAAWILAVDIDVVAIHQFTELVVDEKTVLEEEFLESWVVLPNQILFFNVYGDHVWPNFLNRYLLDFNYLYN